MALKVINRLDNELLVNYPQLWMIRPLLFLAHFLGLTAVALLLALVWPPEQTGIMDLIRQTSIADQDNAAWVQECASMDDEAEFEACLFRQLPNPALAAYEELNHLAATTGLSALQLSSVDQATQQVRIKTGVFVILQFFVYTGVLLSQYGEPGGTSRAYSSVWVFFAYYAVLLLMLLPLVLLWRLVFPWDGLTNLLFINVGFFPLAANLALALAISSALSRSKNIGDMESKTLSVVDWLTTLPFMLWIFAAFFMLLSLRMEQPVTGLVIASLLYVALLPLILAVVLAWHSNYGNNPLRIRGINIASALGEVFIHSASWTVSLLPVWIMVRLWRMNPPENLAWYSTLVALGSLLLGLVIVWLFLPIIHRLRALPE